MTVMVIARTRADTKRAVRRPSNVPARIRNAATASHTVATTRTCGSTAAVGRAYRPTYSARNIAAGVSQTNRSTARRATTGARGILSVANGHQARQPEQVDLANGD